MTKTFIEFDLVQRPDIDVKNYLDNNEARRESFKQGTDKKNGEQIYHTATKGLFPVDRNLVITSGPQKDGSAKTLVTVDGVTKYPIVQEFNTVKKMLADAGVKIIETPSPSNPALNPDGKRTLNVSDNLG